MANQTLKMPGTIQATIAGFFRDEVKAENAIEELKAAGFSDAELGVATPHHEGKTGNFWGKISHRFGKHMTSCPENSLRAERKYAA
jgi:hypothetical protein